MNKKDKVIFFLWISLCVLIVGFMIGHVIKTQIDTKQAEALINLVNIGGLLR